MANPHNQVWPPVANANGAGEFRAQCHHFHRLIYERRA
jgi:hypothetical protein